MKLKKKSIKKMTKKNPKSIMVNTPNPWLKSWSWDNLIVNKSKQIVKFNSQSTQILKDEIEKINYKKGTNKNSS